MYVLYIEKKIVTLALSLDPRCFIMDLAKTRGSSLMFLASAISALPHSRQVSLSQVKQLKRLVPDNGKLWMRNSVNKFKYIFSSTGWWMVMLEVKAKIQWHTTCSDVLESIREKEKKMVRTIIVNESSFWPAIRIATFEPAWTHVGRPDSKQFTTIITWQTGSRHFT